MSEKKRVATYERVSSEDQKERDTIRMQTEQLAARLALDDSLTFAARFQDNGVSGTIPLVNRKAGKEMMAAAEAHLFDELWIYNIKRLGRDAVDLLWVRRRLETLKIRLVSLQEGPQDNLLGFDVQAVVADNDRRSSLKVMNDGMNSAARAGYYTGGVVPLGFQVIEDGRRRRLVPSDAVVWGEWSEADLIRHLFQWVASEGWSCRQVAKHLNALGVPTAGNHWGKGVRRYRTQSVWTAGAVRNRIVQPIYKGLLLYGRRSVIERELIAAPVEPLLSEELWDAAQRTLAGNRLMPKNTDRLYLLRSKMRCGDCGRHYVGSFNKHRGGVWYRCNGYLGVRDVADRCPAKMLRGSDIEPVIWHDVEQFLRHPGSILEQLLEPTEQDNAADEERAQVHRALSQKAEQRERLVNAYGVGVIQMLDLQVQLERLEMATRLLEQRLAELSEESTELPAPVVTEDLVQELCRRLNAGLSETDRFEVVRLLLKEIVVHTGVSKGQKEAKVVATYNFPVVVPVGSGTGASRNYTKLQRVVLV